jgi:hypothetical protein
MQKNPNHTFKFEEDTTCSVSGIILDGTSSGAEDGYLNFVCKFDKNGSLNENRTTLQAILPKPAAEVKAEQSTPTTTDSSKQTNTSNKPGRTTYIF